MTKQLLSLQDETRDIADTSAEKDQGRGSASTSLGYTGDSKVRPQWMTELQKHVEAWLEILPPHLQPLPTGKKLERLVQNPLYRCMQREFTVWDDKLKKARSDLLAMKSVLSGATKADNHVRALFKCLRQDKVPAEWLQDITGVEIKELGPTDWLTDLSRRIKQFATVQQLADPAATNQYSDLPIWLGGLIQPEAFVAATRQAVAQAHGWSLEQLRLKVTVNDNSPAQDSFTFTGLSLQGAEWKEGQLAISTDKTAFTLPPVRFTWVTGGSEDGKDDGSITIPCYLDHSRTEFLFTVNLRRPLDLPAQIWTQRGTCITVYSFAAAVLVTSK